MMMFGHNLGAYAGTAVLNFKHNITSVAAASGFDDPMEQWGYSVKCTTGILSSILSNMPSYIWNSNLAAQPTSLL